MGFGLFQTRTELKAPKRGKLRERDLARGPVLTADIFRKQGCAGCALRGKCKRPAASGSKHPDVYVLGDFPSDKESKAGTHFMEPRGRALRRMLPDAGACRFNNLICATTPNQRDPTFSEIESCRNRVIADIEKYKPFVVVAVGKVALQWVCGESSIDKWRGRRIPVKIGEHTCWCYPVDHPSFVFNETRLGELHKVMLRVDLKAAFAGVKCKVPKDLPVQLATLFDDVEIATPALGIRWVLDTLQQAGDCERLAIDIETTNVRPYESGSQILSMALATPDWTRAFPISHSGGWWSTREQLTLMDAIRVFLRSRSIKVAHNLPFELEWLMHFHGNQFLAGKGWDRWECTQAQAYCLDERSKGHVQKLDHLTFERLGFRLKEQSNLDVARLAIAPVDKVLKYNALDAKYTLRLDTEQRKALHTNGLWKYYVDQVKRQPAVSVMQRRGLPVDGKLVQEFDVSFTATLAQVEQDVQSCEEVRDYRKKTGSPFVLEGTGSVACLKRVFGKTEELWKPKEEGGGFTTNSKVFSALKSPLARLILKHREYTKLLTTYTKPMLPGGKFVYADGCAHCSVNTTFTDTGRLSIDSPSGQNWPKRKHAEIRKIVYAPKGHKLVAADAKQIEVCVVAVMSGDKVLLDAVKHRKDIHLKYAEMLSENVPEFLKYAGKGEIKKVRSSIKSLITFPFFYGASAWTAAKNIHAELARANRKVAERCKSHIKDVCEQISAEFWEEYHGVKAWQNKLVKFYERYGYVECMNGRRRRGPMSINQFINMPIQGTASDLIIDALIRLDRKSIDEDRPALAPILNIHDDLTLLIPDATFDDDVADVVYEMCHTSYDWMGDCPLGIEVTYGPNWYEQEVLGTFYTDDFCEMNRA